MAPAGPSDTPSPRWASRAITSCSITLRLDEELAIAVAAEDRGRHAAADAPSLRNNKRGDFITNRLMDRRIAHDSLLDVAASRFELRFNQCNDRRSLFEKVADRRQHQLE